MRTTRNHAEKAHVTFVKHILLGLFSFGMALQASAAVTEATPTAGSAEEIRAFIRANPGSLVLPQAVAGLYEKVVAKNSFTDLTDFIEEFPDFPDVVGKAKAARLKLSGLESRHTFREGKIGERYVPSYSESRWATETYTLNGKTYTESRRTGDSTYGGYKTDRNGYTVVYQLFNESSQPYIVTLNISGTSSMSRTEVESQRDAWGVPKLGQYQHVTHSDANRISKTATYLIKPGESIKEQEVVGETRPADFELEFAEIKPVESSWVNGLHRCLDGQCDLKTIAWFLADSTAAPWHENLRDRFTRTASKQVDVLLVTGPRFDPDFVSPVVVTLKNKTGIPIQVDFKPNFGSGVSLTLNTDKPQIETVQAQGVSKDNLRVELVEIAPVIPPSRTKPKASGRFAENLFARQTVREARAAEEKKNAEARAAEEKKIAEARAAEDKNQAELRKARIDADLVRDAGFIDMGNGTLVDQKTGLHWMRCSLGQEWNGKTCAGQAKRARYYEVVEKTNLKKYSYAGFDDWRIPSKDELKSIVLCTSGRIASAKKDYVEGGCEGNYTRPTILNEAFPNSKRDADCHHDYWTSTQYKYDEDDYWFVNFYDGKIFLNKAMRTCGSEGSIRYVRKYTGPFLNRRE